MKVVNGQRLNDNENHPTGTPNAPSSRSKSPSAVRVSHLTKDGLSVRRAYVRNGEISVMNRCSFVRKTAHLKRQSASKVFLAKVAVLIL